MKIFCNLLPKRALFIQAFFFFIVLKLVIPTQSSSEDKFAVLPSPVLSSKYYPCSNCHSRNNRQAEETETPMHVEIKIKNHFGDESGCNACHDTQDRNKLRIYNGSTLDILSSSELCGQCHGSIYKIWKSGIHGKVVGRWNGPRKYTPCTACHNPHQPKFMPLVPEQPPTPPEQTLRRKK